MEGYGRSRRAITRNSGKARGALNELMRCTQYSAPFGTTTDTFLAHGVASRRPFSIQDNYALPGALALGTTTTEGSSP